MSNVRNTTRHYRVLLCLSALSLSIACQAEDRFDGPYPEMNIANGVSPSDPRAEGQWYFFNDTWGGELDSAFPPANFVLDLLESQSERFGPQFSNLGLLVDPNDDLPIGLKRGTHDASRLEVTCALCHVSKREDGGYWAGAPNNKLQYGELRRQLHTEWVAAGNTPYMDELALEKLANLPPGFVDVSSDSFSRAIPANFPPYFRLGEAPALNYLGSGKDLRSELALSVFSSGSNDELVEFPSDSKLQAFTDYIGELQPPPAPASDSASIENGRQLFVSQRCGSCHHIDVRVLDGVIPVDSEQEIDRFPGDDDDWPLGSIATSLEHRVLIDGSDEEEADDRSPLIWLIIRKGLNVTATDGYRTPLLAGLAETAPYLHNGSVPTLEALLLPPAERPQTFDVEGFTLDTTKRGYSNQGHAFGGALSAPQRSDLVAYLLSLD